MTAIHPDVLPDELDSVARIKVRTNSVDPPLLRRMLNLIPGASVQITLVDDPVTEEVEITVAVPSAPPSGAAGGVLDGTFPNPGLNASVAGAGLVEAADVLAVNPDGSTLEVVADAVRVKDSGIVRVKLEPAQRLPTGIVKGDSLHGSAADTVSRTAVPANGNALLADSGETNGWRAIHPETIIGFSKPNGIAASETNTQMFYAGAPGRFVAHRAGYIAGLSAYLLQPVTNGTCILSMRVNGSVVGSTITISSADPNGESGLETFEAILFAADDEISVTYTTNGAFATVANQFLTASVFVVFD